jgi:osmoprotectant transport system ATP-binding protein
VPRPSDPVIELRHVRKSYGGGRPAVDDVSFSIGRGEFVALLGASGSGKTTTLKTINRLIEPDSGEVLVEGARTDAEPAHLLRRRIGYVFQASGLFPHLTVGENIGITPKLLGATADEIAGRVGELLDLVSLPADFAKRLPSDLSGGERQRVGVARALAARPAVVLMDEPFGALDPVTRDTLGTAYRELHQRLGLTTLMVTHDVMEAVLLADRILVMDQGRLIAEGTAAELNAEGADARVAALMSTPRRQAERVREALGG